MQSLLLFSRDQLCSLHDVIVDAARDHPRLLFSLCDPLLRLASVLTSALQLRSNLNDKILSIPGIPQGLVDLRMCSTPEFPVVVLAVASQPRGGGSGVAVFAASAACLRSGDAALVRRFGYSAT
jgi:hypothetical protein